MIELGEYEIDEGQDGEEDFDEELVQIMSLSELYDLETEEGGETDDVDLMNGYFGIPGLIQFSRGEGDLPRVFLKHPYSESAAEIYLHGATITQWLRPDGSHALAPRGDAQYDGISPIESGVKLCFPQHREGRLPEDGFANKLTWEVVAAGLDFLPFGDGFHHLHPDEERIKEMLKEAEDYRREKVEEEAAAARGEKLKEDLSKGRKVEPHKGLVSNPSQDEVVQFLAARSMWDAEVVEKGDPKELAQVDYRPTAIEPLEDEADLPHMLLPFEIPGAFGYEVEDEAPGEGEGEREREGELDHDTPSGHVEPATNDLDVYTRLLKKMWDTGRDPAPYVTLRLKDCEETRLMGWDHKFELLYKITLMENDDFDDLNPDPKQETFTTAVDGADILKATMEKQEAKMRVFESHAAQEPDPDLDEVGLKEDPGLKPSLMGAKEEFAADVGEEALEDLYEIDPEYDDEALERDGLVRKVPMQLRMQLRLINKDEAGKGPMSFQVAHLAHIATKDMTEHGDFIRIRGLGGSHVIDYSVDERKPKLSIFQEDYVNFFGQRVDTTFVNAAAADVSICPGDRSHFELIPRQGYKDVVVYHPGTLRSTSREDPEESTFWAALGPARASIPQKLGPGETWVGDFVLRFHERYWPDAIWGDEEMMKPIENPSAAQLNKDSTAPEGMDPDMNYTGWGGLEEE